MRAYVVNRYNNINKKWLLKDLYIRPAIYKCITTGELVALYSIHGEALDGVTELVIEEKVKVPLYKEAMYRQMGRHLVAPTHRKVMLLTQIDKYDLREYYSVYIARF